MVSNRPIKEKFQLWGLTNLLKLFFLTEQHLLKIKSINYPQEQFIFSMWHCHQCLVYGVKDKSSFYALISASNDGEIIAKAAECLNIKSVRGSTQRRGVAASLELIEKLKEGNSAGIMVDGPRGPKGKVKDGIINIAKITGVPIVPVAWHSKDKTFFHFNSWDRFIAPFGPCKTVALYGNPISIPSELTKEETKFWCEKIETEMNNLQNDLETNYDKYLNQPD
ncbi:MAG: lysophospholipid acyltransferase family protein [Candidatus Gastranaerophilales bacterium]|nr:lysophospholipid acyltransferase family protein [Candidatus Gastranaerophilales bacterium]